MASEPVPARERMAYEVGYLTETVEQAIIKLDGGRSRSDVSSYLRKGLQHIERFHESGLRDDPRAE